MAEYYQKKIPHKARLFLEHLPPEERERDIKQMYAVTTFLGLRDDDWDERLFGSMAGGGPRPFNGAPEGKGGEPRPPRLGEFFKRPGGGEKPGERPGERIPPEREPFGGPQLKGFDDSPKGPPPK